MQSGNKNDIIFGLQNILDKIVHTPARVFKYDEDQLIKDTLKDFLILD